MKISSNQGTHEKKAHFEFGLHAGNIDYWNIMSFQTLRKNTKNRITCLNFSMVAVWICICLDMNYLRIWIIKSASKNWSKMGFIAVDITEVLSLTVLENGNKISIFLNNSANYHISAKFPGSVDGRELALSYEIKILKI